MPAATGKKQTVASTEPVSKSKVPEETIKEPVVKVADTPAKKPRAKTAATKTEEAVVASAPVAPVSTSASGSTSEETAETPTENAVQVLADKIST